MIWTAAGTWGVLAWGIALLGAPVQIAIGVMLAMRRPVPVMAAMLLPVLVMGLGVLGVFLSLDEAHAALRDPPDPAFVGFFALHDRASALAPGVLAGFAGAFLTLGPAAGAAWGTLREPQRSYLGPMIAGPASAVALLLGALGGAAGASPWWALPVVGVGLAVLGFLAGISVSAATVRHVNVPMAGVGSLVIGALGLCAAGIAAVECGLADVFSSFEDPWAGVAAIIANGPGTARAEVLVMVATCVAMVGVMPGLLTIRARRLGLGAGLDLATLVAAVLTILLGSGWVLAKRVVLTRLGGAYAAAVFQFASAFDVPHVLPPPAQVFVSDGHVARMIAFRGGGGVEITSIPPEAEDVGRRLRSGDGVVLAPELTADALYLAIVGSDAGIVSLVGCQRANDELASRIQRDALLAAGRCGAFPLRLRVTDTLDNPRVLIVLKEHFIDDGGNVIGLPDLTDVAGRDVVLRLQLDATIADLAVVLRRLTDARRVYLGWGVSLDGDDIPVGLDPGTRVLEK